MDRRTFLALGILLTARGTASAVDTNHNDAVSERLRRAKQSLDRVDAQVAASSDGEPVKEQQLAQHWHQHRDWHQWNQWNQWHQHGWHQH